MKLVILFVLTFVFGSILMRGRQQTSQLFTADNSNIHYVGRIDFTNPLKPRFWSPGVYLKAKFRGTSCEVLLNDENLYGTSHNYIEIAVDDQPPYRIQLLAKENVIKVGNGLSNTTHIVTICKDTESGIGYIDFLGLRCEQLMPLPAEPRRKIEFIGNSITCGAGMDLATTPCGTGQWYDTNNAYMAYGPLTARTLNAQWQLTSVSGIGLMHSCCNMKIVMPQVFDKIKLATDSLAWDFKRYQPNVVTVCLGQNDGIQDSTTFCNNYIRFIGNIRNHYPKADIICLSSPMADQPLTSVLQRYITGINRYENQTNGDRKVHHYFFSRQYHNGCGGHPDMAEHQLIANELIAYIRQLEHW
ncbi:MAG: SGNH/GDSL hydrolase family protein [Mucilaginibacter sp.]